MTKAIITGPTGTLGMALISELIHKRIETLVICNPNSPRKNIIPVNPLVKIVYCSLENLESLENVNNDSYDVLFHLGWIGTTGACRDDMYIQNNNIKYSLDAVSLAKRFGCSLFIGAGSQAEYGRCDTSLNADTPIKPETGYGIAKFCAGQMTRNYAHQLGLKHIWIRILSLYGPYDFEKSMIMTLINHLKNNTSPMLTKGEQLWDYLYSEDAAEAFYYAAQTGKDSSVYVLGSGVAVPLIDYITIIRDIISPKTALHFNTLEYSDKQVMYLCADISAITYDTGWKPKTDFITGINTILANI